MALIKKGDLIELNNRRYIALCDDYTKLVRDPESWDHGFDMSSASGAVRASQVDLEGKIIEIIYSRHGVPKIIENSNQ